MTVFVMTRATVSPSPGLEMDPREPPLNAKKPKNRMNPPRAAVLRVQRKKKRHQIVSLPKTAVNVEILLNFKKINVEEYASQTTLAIYKRKEAS